jgi:glycopeptide antibiotics resistance protein
VVIKILVLCFSLVYFIINVDISKKKVSQKILYILVVGIYLIDVAFFTLLGRQPLENHIANFVPGQSYLSVILNGWYYSSKYVLCGIIGNVMMLVPFGIIVSVVLNKKSNIFVIGAIGLLFSLTIEILQYCFCIGSFEVDDLINNTWGAVIGGSVFQALCVQGNGVLKARITRLMPLIIFSLIIVAISSVPLTKLFIK